MSAILDQYGQPATTKMSDTASKSPEAMMKAVSSYIMAVAGVRSAPSSRVWDPYSNHPWVYAAATAQALNIAQVPFYVYTETDNTLDLREKTAIRLGRSFERTRPPRGPKRRAVQRHLRKLGRRQGMKLRGLEIDYDHPATDLFTKTRDAGSTTVDQRWFLTVLWMCLRGEAFWLCMSDDGEPVPWTSAPAQMWCVSPDLMQEELYDNRLVGWTMTVDRLSGLPGQGKRIFLNVDEVVHFMFPNPAYPIRGLSPLASAAAYIALDMAAVRLNLATADNGGEPSGILTFGGMGEGFKDEAEKEKFKLEWEQRHQGPATNRKTAILTGGWKYEKLSLSPKDLEWLEGSKLDREIILAVLGTPKSVVSVTDDLNFATSLSQDRNFWDRRLLPMMFIFESVLDSTLFFLEPDSVVGAFDTSVVEALRVGIGDKVTTMNLLTGAPIHATPKAAAEVVGLDLPDYEGDNVCFVPPMLTTVEKAIEAANEPAPPPMLSGQFGQPLLPGGGQDDADEPQDSLPGPAQDENRSPADEPPDVAKFVTSRMKSMRQQRMWQAIVRQVQLPYERLFKSAWRGWALVRSQDQLRKFDKFVKSRGIKAYSAVIKADEGDFDIEDVLLDTSELESSLREKFRPLYDGEMHDVWDFTQEEIGIPTFGFDDPRISAAMDSREDILAGTAPESIQKSLRRSLRKGLVNGESVQQLRDRVATEYGIQTSSAKALQVARTESSGFMNQAREAMFSAQGFDKREWVTAGDEHVRQSHVRFGQVGPKQVGFDYLSLYKKGAVAGKLTYPHDPQAPAGEVINCRCVHLPA